MEIFIVHKSITQRKVFLNCLRKTGYKEARAFEDKQAAVKSLNGTPVRLTIIDKEALFAESSGRGGRAMRTLMERSEALLVTSYQFTQDEALELLDTADELLLMPFAPDVLKEKIHTLCASL